MGIPIEISGTVGGDCILSEDLIVIREDCIVLGGREATFTRIVGKMLEILPKMQVLFVVLCNQLYISTVIYQKSTSESEFQNFRTSPDD